MTTARDYVEKEREEAGKMGASEGWNWEARSVGSLGHPGLERGYTRAEWLSGSEGTWRARGGPVA